ncbi:hypothetical protein MMAN_01940 [Mycobacterium mantenii]|uniref:Uncharacterized protein n=1 Tax=Mycobacterium mantenii TaxID=560555 RepID=A0A1X0FKQ6_MYCNT|nr:hypothetical protein [Mycobacterium mantenii]MCV7246139.1 hypothetical protein [Mycobacterium mantenii]ORB02356.1 hypothetical protein BST30_20260 [Mycobacterium mantenii]BBY36060.1 hypothetical protein MMAN_01940 [Mycobacterium mantenii]
MELTAILCNHAEAQNNLLYISAGGIDQVRIPAGHSVPFTVSVGIGIIVEVPRTASDREHTVDIGLLDSDGCAVEVQKGVDGYEPFRAQFQFNIGRSSSHEADQTQSVAFAVNIPVLRLEKLGSYVFTVSVDETVQRRLPYRLVEQAA